MDMRRSFHSPQPFLWSVVPALVLLGTVAIRGGTADAPGVLVTERIRLENPTPARAELIRWAADRYGAAGLDLPAITLRFHDTDAGCRGNVGWTEGSHVDVCGRVAMEAGPQRIVLHELAHAWCDTNLGEDDRAAFDALRGVSTWNDGSSTWKQRGTEQAADIVAWGLGDGSMLPLIDGDRAPAALAEAFRFLTGTEPLHDSATAA
jgi:hypothetical protein